MAGEIISSVWLARQQYPKAGRYNASGGNIQQYHRRGRNRRPVANRPQLPDEVISCKQSQRL